MSPVLGDEELRRLRWKCRRAMLELDLLFGRLLQDQTLDRLNADDFETLKGLLDEPDTQIWQWVQGTEAPPDRFKKILKYIV